MGICMVNMNISIKEEAYRFLKSLKSADKSFSDVILDFKREDKNRNIMSFFGALHDMKIDWNAKEKSMKEFRVSFNKRIEKTAKEMEKIRK